MTKFASSAVALFLLAAPVVQGTSLFRRPSVVRRDATPSPAPTNTLPISLTFDSQGRYILPVSMSSGQPQNFSFTISTGTGLAYVAGSGCTDCGNTPLYNQSASSSAVSLSGSDNTTFFGQSASGSLLKEYCGVKLANGLFWAYPNQTVINVNNTQSSQSSTSLLGNGVSGIFGLGTNRASSSSSGIGFSDSIYGQWFPRNQGRTNFTFGMMLGPSKPKQQAGADAGALHWLKPDSSFYKPDQVVTVPVKDNAGGSGSSNANGVDMTSGQDWMVALDGWSAVVGNTHLSNTGSVVAVVDPMYPNIYLPSDEAKLIHAAISGSSPAPSSFSTLGSQSQAYQVPCDAQYTFALVVGSQSFVLSPNSLIIQQDDGSCISGIEGFTDTSQTQYLVGARFISTVYLIFNVPLNGTPTIGISPRAEPSSKSNVGAIVGGTVGGVAGVIILGLIAFWFLHKRADRRRGPFEIEDPFDKSVQHATVEPFMLGAPISPAPQQSPFASANGNDDSEQFQHLFAAHHDGTHASAISPPSYEEASSTGSPVTARPLLRDHKIARVPVPVSPAAVGEGATTSPVYPETVHAM